MAQIAVFDTAFHGELPPHAFTYALPYELYLTRGMRADGFHGPSHQFMAACASEHLRTHSSKLKLVTCHLGGGASVTAIDGGRSVDTSMGMTPLEGLVMGTRSGDVDPALALVLGQGDGALTPAQIDELLNKKSGLLGLSGVSADFRDNIEAAAAAGNDRAHLAIEVFQHRLRKYIGAYAAVLGGADAICFTGGIGDMNRCAPRCARACSTWASRWTSARTRRATRARERRRGRHRGAAGADPGSWSSPPTRSARSRARWCARAGGAHRGAPVSPATPSRSGSARATCT